MSKIMIVRENLLQPLQNLLGIVERRHTMPILSNVLIDSVDNQLIIKGTDLEIQLRNTTIAENLDLDEPLVVSGRKLHDIVRSLKEGSTVSLEYRDRKLLIKSGSSRFNLMTQDPKDYTEMGRSDSLRGQTVSVSQGQLKSLLERVEYSVAQQDVRFYLNGTFLLIDQGKIVTVATDAHRLAYSSHQTDAVGEKLEVILPRRSVTELIKLLKHEDEPVSLTLIQNQIVFSFSNIELLSKVIEGKYPDYVRAIPSNHYRGFEISRLTLLQSMQRASILSNDKVKGVRFLISSGKLSILCNNGNQEEAHEEIEIEYSEDPIDIGFNITYIIEVLQHMEVDKLSFTFGEIGSSLLITIPSGDIDFKYVVMPMRI